MTKVWILPVLLLAVCWFEPVLSKKENDPCRTYGQDGTCLPYRKCNTLKTWSNLITTCEIGSQSALICCPVPKDVSTRMSADPEARTYVKKCQEYQAFSRKAVSAIGLAALSIVQQYAYPKCETILQLIVGGNKTKAGEFPHMAAIGWRTKNLPVFLCGGSLISERFVLTAAHCYMEDDNGVFPTFVRLGDQNLYRTDDGGSPLDADIDDFILHPQFKRKQGWYNDIALIKLATAVKFNDFIRPACLTNQQEFPSKQVIATGFGYVETGGDKSDDLLKVALQVFDNEECTTKHKGSRQLRSGMKDSQLCVGSSTGGFDTCQGDSGGPIQIARQENHCVYLIAGVTSFGPAYCGSKTPAVYTRVGAYLDWIESHVWN